MLKYFGIPSLILFFFSTTIISPVFSQFSVSSTAPSNESLGICIDTADFSFEAICTIASAGSVAVNIEMPPGIHYLSGSFSTVGGSVSMGVDSFVDSLLVLTSSDLTAGDTMKFQYSVSANGQALSYFQGANTFIAQMSIDYNGGSSYAYNTGIFNNAITYAELSMPQPTPPLATVGEIVTRSLTIYNGGDGCLDSFSWYDAYGADISIDSVYFQGNKLNTTTNGDTIFYTFSSAEFQQMGNLDGQFCSEDGSITIVEYIHMVGCSDKDSDLKVYWGCDGMNPVSFSTTADVSFSAPLPNLAFTFRDKEMPSCFDSQPNRKEMIVQNVGSGYATGIEIEIKKFYYSGQFSLFKYDGLDTASVELKVGTDTFVKVIPRNVEMNTYGNSCSLPYAYRFTVDVPDILSGDSVVIAFDMINCEPDVCLSEEIRQGAWGYNYRYTVPCGGGTVKVDNRYGGIGGKIKFLTNNYDNPTVAENQAITLTTLVQSAEITYAGAGRYIVRYILPDCGLSFSGNSTDLFWRNIGGSVEWPQVSFSQSGDTITAAYDVSGKPSEFDLAGSEIALKATGSCNCANPDSIQTLTKMISYTPDPACDDPAEIDILCETVELAVDLCTPIPCDGMQADTFFMKRTNFGLPDNDKDRRPDASGVLDMDSIRLDRMRLGDTLHTEIRGIVVGSSSFEYGYVDFHMDLAEYFSSAGATVRVWDDDGGSGSGAYIECSDLPMTNIGDSLFRVDISPGALEDSCSDFASWLYGPDDTVWVTGCFAIDSTSNNTLDVGYINPVSMYLSDESNPALAEQASCGTASFSGKFQIIPMVDQSFVNQLAGSGGGTTQARTYINMFTAGSYLDMFPYEYRTWSFPDSLIVTPPDSFKFENAYVLFRFYPYIYTMYVTPDYTSEDSLIFNLRQLIDDGTWILPDDGYELQFFTTWSPYCYSEHNTDVNVPVEAKMWWDAGLGFYDTPKEFEPKIRHYAPTLFPSSINASTQDGVKPEVTWNLSISNSSAFSASPNTFVSFFSPSGKIQIESVAATNGSAFTANNGIYELGTIAKSSALNFNVTASYSTCELDTLYMYSGWDVDSYPNNLHSFPCEIDTLLLRIDPKPAAAQLSVTTAPSGSINLCDDLNYEFAINSTQLGNVSELSLEIFHPQGGINLNLNGTELEYPVGSGFSAMTDPDTISGGFQFNLEEYDNTLNSDGLAGLNESNANLRQANVRIALEADCDFLSGDAIYVRLCGQNPCGEQITLLRVLDPLDIGGISNPYTMDVNTQTTSIVGCEGTNNFRVSLSPDGGTTSGSDQISVIIPVGIDFDQNSIQSVHNGPSGSPTESDLGALGTQYTWAMPDGITSGDSIVFEFDIEPTDSSGCSSSDLQIITSTTFSANAHCGGQSCSNFYGTTGTEALFLNLQKPDLDMSYFSSSISASGQNYIYQVNMVLRNNGLALDGSKLTTIEFFEDRDRNQSFSGGDTILGIYSDYLAIGSGSIVNLMHSITIPQNMVDPLNDLLAIVQTNPSNGAAQCLCNSLGAFYSADVFLPVEWIEVGGEDRPDHNLIYWTVITDPESKGFLIEKRNEKSSLWEQLEFVPVQHESKDPKSFSFKDYGLQPKLYYRLKHIYLDGSTDFSNVIELKRILGTLIKVYPNPATEFISVESPGEMDYEIINMLGQPIQTGALRTGVNTIALSDWMPGMYVIRMSDERGKKAFKFKVE